MNFTYSPLLENSIVFTAVLLLATCPILKLATSVISLTLWTKTFPFALPENMYFPRLSNEAAMFKSS